MGGCDQECPDFLGLVIDENRCECVCIEKECKRGQHFNHDECKCVDEDYCDLKMCPYGQRPDFEKCECVVFEENCNKECPEHMVLDEERCEC